jgi:beta-glucanase (GH16 family)
MARRPATAPTSQASLASEWKLVWADEFEQPGAEIDPAKWQFEKGMIRNREAQLYTDRSENVRVEDGCLVIEARKERMAVPNKRAGTFAEYTSGSVETFSKAAWKHGRVEVRAKCPRGWGMWPAVWMMGTNITEVGWPACGEIDVMENVGFEPDKVHASIHFKGRTRDVDDTSTAIVEQLAREFHLYAMEWDGKQVRIFVDGRRYFTFDRDDAKAAWPLDQPMYLKLNLAVGGQWGGRHGIDDAVFPQRFVIDYVRVYERAEAGK